MYLEREEQFYAIKPTILPGPYPILHFVPDEMVIDFAKKGTKVTGTVSSVAEKGITAAGMAAKPQSEKTAMLLTPKDFPGGIKAPHVHYNGDIFLLNKKDWKAFSGKIVEEFRAKLADAQGINYDQLMRLSDIMQEIV